MKVREIANYLDNAIPYNLKESYDNVGLMVGDEEKVVSKILLALDCTNNVIDEAIKMGANLIITHHPLLFIRPSSIIKSNLQGGKIFKLIQNDIALYSAHTNLDSISGGLNEVITRMLGFDESEIMDKNFNAQNAGIGRVVTLEKSKTCEELIQIVKDNLKCNDLRIAKGNQTINKIAIINGSGQDFFYKAMQMGANAIITGDTTYHFVSDFKEMGITIIDAGHFNTEWLIFVKSITEKLANLKGLEIIKSSTSSDPYEFV
ncbi:MAG: Nif3-like dinuclear metal center hexameric protein [Clostridium sp.]